MLGNISLRCTPLDRALLLTSDDSGILQVIGHVRHTTHELAMIAGALSAFCNEVRDCTATREHGIGDPRITAINNNGGSFAQDANSTKLLGGGGVPSRRVQKTHVD